MNEIKEFAEITARTADKNLLKKVVFSKAADKDIIKSVGMIKIIGNKKMMQIESFFTDGKARHFNIPIEKISESIQSISGGYMQVNLISSIGDCELKISKNGKITLLGGIKLQKNLTAQLI